MEKVKVFLFDELQLGLPFCHLLDRQTYCFPVESGRGWGLFYSPRRRVKAVLIENEAFSGCEGELWEVDEECFRKLHSWYSVRGARKSKMYLPGSSPVCVWSTSLADLGGAKMRQIRDFRDTLSAGGKRTYRNSAP